MRYGVGVGLAVGGGLGVDVTVGVLAGLVAVAVGVGEGAFFVGVAGTVGVSVGGTAVAVGAAVADGLVGVAGATEGVGVCEFVPEALSLRLASNTAPAAPSPSAMRTIAITIASVAPLVRAGGGRRVATRVTREVGCRREMGGMGVTTGRCDRVCVAAPDGRAAAER